MNDILRGLLGYNPLGRGSVVRTYGPGGGRGGPPGGAGSVPSWGTGPAQHGLLPGEFDVDPSQDSLTRARFNDYSQSIDALHNKGAGQRLEDASAAARGATAGALGNAGIDPNSLQGAMLAANTQASAIDAAFGREAELDANLLRERAAHKGNIAQMEQSRGDSLYERWRGEQALGLERERVNIAQQQQDTAASQANIQTIIQLLSNPQFRELFGGALGGGF